MVNLNSFLFHLALYHADVMVLNEPYAVKPSPLLRPYNNPVVGHTGSAVTNLMLKILVINGTIK
jgi:hypothetical protein